MKHNVTRFKNLSVALKELEPFIRDGEHLQTGKPFKRLSGMRSREALANWLICAAVNSDHDADRLSFTSDPTGGDGVIYDSHTEITWKTEHVLVPRPRSRKAATAADVEPLILNAVTRKQGKGGAAYASGKQLIVFLNSAGAPWVPNRVAKKLPKPLHFEYVWVVVLQYVDHGDYVYGVTQLDTTGGDSPVWCMRIAADFGSWLARRIQ